MLKQLKLLQSKMKIKKKMNKIRKKYRPVVREYLTSSSINGLKYIFEANRSKIEIFIWILIMSVIFSIQLYVIYITYNMFVQAPTTFTQLPQRKSITTIPFPAVGVCIGNRLSKSLLLKMAEDFFTLQNRTKIKLGGTVTRIYDLLLLFGSFYNYQTDEFKFYELNRLHSFLIEIYNGTYSMHAIVKSLQKPCTQYLRNCRWQGQDVACDKIYFQRKTHLGLCCLFNHQRPTAKQFQNIILRNDINPKETPILLHGPGVDMGLTTVVDNDFDDFAFFINSNLANFIFVFDPMAYADEASGAMTQRTISPGQEMFISLHPEPIIGHKSMEQVPPSSRGCKFHYENDLTYSNFYSFSECNLACMVDNIIQSCGCFPFYVNALYNVTECLLTDYICLQGWSNKWNSLEMELGPKSKPSSHCPHCLPTCDYIKYEMESSWGYISEDDGSRENCTTNCSVFHVYFGDAFVIEYQQSIVQTWYDLLSNFGGIFSIMIGASLMSIAEILYFLTGRFFTIFYNEESVDKPAKINKSTPNIYWNELMSHEKYVFRNRFRKTDSFKIRTELQKRTSFEHTINH